MTEELGLLTEEQPEKYLGRKVVECKKFKVKGTFESMYAAEKWLSDNGFSCGSGSAMQPTAIMKGDYYEYELPHKWKNFTAKQKNSVHGVMTGDFREGYVFVRIFVELKKTNQ